MLGSARKGRVALALSVAAMVALPASAIAQPVASDAVNSPTQTGTNSGNSSGSSGSASQGTNNQSISQHAGNNSQLNATNQNCVGAGCQNNNITNQNQVNAPAAPVRPTVFERVVPTVRPVAVRRVQLAFTGLDLRTLFLIGGLLMGAGTGVLFMQRRGLLSLRRSRL